MSRLTVTLAASIAVVVFVTCGLFLGASTMKLGKLEVFAGSASKPALEECVEVFKGETGIEVEIHFSGSGTMLSQMKITRRGDLYIPGSPDYMVKALREGVVYPENIKIISYLVPAIIVQRGNPKKICSLEDLAKPGVKVGIGDPDSVCVGGYAVEILKYNNLYDRVKGNIVVYAESCSKTAALVTTGAVDAIIGWRVFHFWNPDKTDVIYIEPNYKVPRVSYIPAAISKYTKDRGLAEKLLNFLVSPEAQKIFEKYGYISTEEEVRRYAPNAVVPET